MIAVISDVHGNLPALEAVLADIDAHGASRIWCLGDTTGYGPYVNECLELVVRRCELILAGNHDLAVRGDLQVGLFGGSAGAGVVYAQQVLTAEGLQLLRALSAQRLLDDVELYHASARDPVWEYVRTAEAAAAHLAVQRAPLSFVGHSHMQLTFVDTGGGVEGGAASDGAVVELDGRKRVVNPGSVGQPRDRNPAAAYALVERERVTFRRVAYDTSRMHEAVRQAGLPSEIAERLELGW